MLKKNAFPKIESYLQDPRDNANNLLYQEIIGNNLLRILPPELFQNYALTHEIGDDERTQFKELLPIVSSALSEEAPNTASFYLVCVMRPGVAKFFFDLMARWLVPGKRFNVLLVFSADFTMPELSVEAYTVCQVVLQVESQVEFEIIKRNYPIIETEARLGAKSSYFARRILEIKGLTSDEKTGMIQDYITSLVARLPNDFDSDIYTEMQHVLVICKEEFKNVRGPRHLSRIISIQYLFRKWLREIVKSYPKKRYFALKIFRARLGDDNHECHVLGIVVAVNFLQEKEIFEQRHLLKAIQNYIPGAEAVQNSFFSNRWGSENLCTLYMEITKPAGKGFTGEEIRILRRELPNDLQDRIEHLMPPLFMPRNDEEIMRNILNLSSQIKYLSDAPQVFISFDQQDTVKSNFYSYFSSRVEAWHVAHSRTV